MARYHLVARVIAIVLLGLLSASSERQAAAQGIELHTCAIQLRLNSHDAGYGGSGTGTLVRHGNGYYLVTAYHNLERADKIGLGLDYDALFSIDTFHPRFMAVRNADFIVAKFLDDKLRQDKKDRFRKLFHNRATETVVNPPPGLSLAAVGNPVFSYESYRSIQHNIVYGGMVAEYVKPNIVTGAIEYINAEMMVLESLSVMPGFSGGPLLLVRDGIARDGDVAGIVVGGDPRSVVSPGRFVFAVPPVDIEKAILALDDNLKNPGVAPPPGFEPLETDLAKLPRAGKKSSTHYSDQVVVIDPGKSSYQVNDDFLRGVADKVRDTDMIFNGGRFESVDLSILKPSRSTFVQCVFTDDKSLLNANLMGARFIGCMFETSDGKTRAVRVRPSLGYGITVIDGLVHKTDRVEAPGIFSVQALALSANNGGEGRFAEMKEADADSGSKLAPALPNNGSRSAPTRRFTPLSKEFKLPKSSSDNGVRFSRGQFENMLTEDLIPDEN